MTPSGSVDKASINSQPQPPNHDVAELFGSISTTLDKNIQKYIRIFSGIFFGNFWPILGYFDGSGEVLEGPGTISDDFGRFLKFRIFCDFLLFFASDFLIYFGPIMSQAHGPGPGPGRPR